MCVGAGEDDPPPEAVASLLEATSFWEFAPLLMRGRNERRESGALLIIKEMVYLTF